MVKTRGGNYGSRSPRPRPTRRPRATIQNMADQAARDQELVEVLDTLGFVDAMEGSASGASGASPRAALVGNNPYAPLASPATAKRTRKVRSNKGIPRGPRLRYGPSPPLPYGIGEMPFGPAPRKVRRNKGIPRGPYRMMARTRKVRSNKGIPRGPRKSPGGTLLARPRRIPGAPRKVRKNIGIPRVDCKAGYERYLKDGVVTRCRAKCAPGAIRYALTGRCRHVNSMLPRKPRKTRANKGVRRGPYGPTTTPLRRSAPF